MKIKKTIVALIVFFPLAVSNADGVELNLKLSGNFSLFSPHDIHHTAEDWVEWYVKESDRRESWTFLSGEAAQLKSGLGFEGEVFLSLTSHLSVSLGAGFCYGEISPEKSELSTQQPLGEFKYNLSQKISAIPIIASAYFLFNLSSKFKLYVKGGAGTVWTKYIEREGKKGPLAKRFSYLAVQNATAFSPLLSGGFGIFYETEPGLSLFIEASYHRAKISGLEGEIEEGMTGTLYYLEEYDPNLDFWQAKNRLLVEEPGGENFRSLRDTMIDLSGFSIKIGIMIRL